MNYLSTCTSRLVVQPPCQVSFKSMQRCRRSWEDKLKCVKILSVKGHNSAKICRTWIISPHALLDLWYNICTKFNSNLCKDVGRVENTNFDGTEGQTKQTLLKCPLAILWRGHKNSGFTALPCSKYTNKYSNTTEDLHFSLAFSCVVPPPPLWEDPWQWGGTPLPPSPPAPVRHPTLRRYWPGNYLNTGCLQNTPPEDIQQNTYM